MQTTNKKQLVFLHFCERHEIEISCGYFNPLHVKIQFCHHSFTLPSATLLCLTFYQGVVDLLQYLRYTEGSVSISIKKNAYVYIYIDVFV